MKTRIQCTLPPEVIEMIDLRRGSVGRGRFVAMLCRAYASTIKSKRPRPASAFQSLGEEVKDMFDEYSAYESPKYGNKPQRHNNPKDR